MKAISVVILASLIISLFSCTKPNNQPSPGNAPTVKVSIDKNSMNAGQTVTITFIASGAVNLKSMKIEDIMSGSTSGFVLKDSIMNTKQLTYALVFSTGITGTRQIKVTVTDANSQTTSDAVPLVVGGTSMPEKVSISTMNVKIPRNTTVTLFVGASSFETLKHIKITRSTASQTDVVLLDSNISGTTFSLQFSTITPTLEGKVLYSVEATDARNTVKSDTCSIISYWPLLDLGDISMDIPNGKYPSFYSTSYNVNHVGSYYDSADAAKYASLIDFCCYNKSIGGPTPCSPFVMNSNSQLSGWGVYNHTLFEKTTNSSLFSLYTVSGQDLKNAFDANITSASEICVPVINSYAIFKTSDGRYGILKFVGGTAGCEFLAYCELN